LLLLACVVAGVAAFIVWPGEREAEYQGKKLSEWLADYQIPGWALLPPPPDKQAAEAVRHFETNALPWLLKWTGYQVPAWRTKLYSGFCKMPRPFRAHALERYLGPHSRDPNTWAMRGFEILGPRASPAIPKLVGMARDPRNPEVAYRALFCLSFIGDQGRDEVKRAALDADLFLKDLAKDVVTRFGREY
jgi:hypothetical protein